MQASAGAFTIYVDTPLREAYFRADWDVSIESSEEESDDESDDDDSSPPRRIILGRVATTQLNEEVNR